MQFIPNDIKDLDSRREAKKNALKQNTKQIPT